MTTIGLYPIADRARDIHQQAAFIETHVRPGQAEYSAEVWRYPNSPADNPTPPISSKVQGSDLSCDANRDIEYGIADTGVRAAILKCATDEPELRLVWNESCARWHKLIDTPEYRSPRTPTRRAVEAWISRRSSPRKALI
jgi:hypothetical protein